MFENNYNGIYGFSFKQRNGGGLGAIIYDVLLAKYYANTYNYKFCFTQEGYEIPRMNGSIIDIDSDDDKWCSFFNSINVVQQDKCCKLWPHLFNNCPFDTEKINIKYLRKILQEEIFIMNPEKDSIIKKLQEETCFTAHDIVIHIRRTDKLSETDEFLNVTDYCNQINFVLDRIEIHSDTRIYICTDNQMTCSLIREKMKDRIEVVWDENESNEPLQLLRWSNQLKKSRAQEETLTAFKNLYIMRDAFFLIGGRMSYFYRIAELLRNDYCLNIQDSDKFGKAQYADKNENLYGIILPKAIDKFIEPLNIELIQDYEEKFHKHNRIIVPNFLNKEISINIKNQLEKYPWWSYAIKNHTSKNPIYFGNLNDKNLQQHFKHCEIDNREKYFSYRFKRHIGEHYNTCVCCCCRLMATLKSCNFIQCIESLTGINRLIANELNIAYYSKGDFINVHADQNKGDIAITLSFTDDWHPAYGGNLHFLDENLNIIETVVPSLSTLCIFRIIENKSLHFVSRVNVDKNRFMISAWYSQDTIRFQSNKSRVHLFN